MTKLSFFLLTCAALLTFQACQSDGGGGGKCNLEGTWKVSTTDVQSDKLPPTVVELTKLEVESSQYSFTADGQVVWLNTSSGTQVQGTWALSETGDELTLTYQDRQPDIFKVANCSAKELKVSQRAPLDPAQEALISINTVLARVE